jgi:hypothetical protein
MSTTSQTRSTAYAVMQRIFEEGFATGDGSVADELCSRDLVDHQFGPPSGRPVDFTVIDVCRVVDGRIVALGSAGPLRGARPDRGARPGGGLTGVTGPPAGWPAGPVWPGAPVRPQWSVGTSDQPVDDGTSGG